MANGFNVDDFRAAHRPWSFTIGGQTFAARHVSALAVQRFERLRDGAGADSRKFDRALRFMLRMAFPWRLSYVIRGDPVNIILALEPPARMAALADFFACLRDGMPTDPKETKTANPSTHKKPRIKHSSTPTQPPSA